MTFDDSDIDLSQADESFQSISAPTPEFTAPDFDDEPESEEFEGFIAGMSNDDYHSLDALSKSGLYVYKDSPTQYWYYRNTPQKSKRVFNVGNLHHEWNQFGKDYVDAHYLPAPEFNLNTVLGREDRKKWEESLTDDQCVIEPSDWEIAKSMHESVYRNPEAVKLLEHPATTFEDSFFWHDPVTGVWCRCRTDILNLELGVAVDIKSMDAKLSWEGSVIDRGYEVQEVMYQDGIKQVTGIDDITFLFLVTPKKETPYTEFKRLQDWHLSRGHGIYRDGLADFARCQKDNAWFLPTDTELPRWVKS